MAIHRTHQNLVLEAKSCVFGVAKCLRWDRRVLVAKVCVFGGFGGTHRVRRPTEDFRTKIRVFGDAFDFYSFLEDRNRLVSS